MNREKIVETMLTLVTGLALLYWIFQSKYLLEAAVIIGVIGIFFKGLSRWIAWAWLKLAEALGLVMPKIVLTLIFFVFLCPIALLSRLFRNDSMQLKRKTEGSYFITRHHRFTAADIKNPW